MSYTAIILHVTAKNDFSPIFFFFCQNLDVDITKASETMQVRILSSYTVVSLIPRGIFLPHTVLVETQLE